METRDEKLGQTDRRECATEIYRCVEYRQHSTVVPPQLYGIDRERRKCRVRPTGASPDDIENDITPPRNVTNPSTKLPMTFTANVPAGNADFPSQALRRRFVSYRESAPTTVPEPTRYAGSITRLTSKAGGNDRPSKTAANPTP